MPKIFTFIIFILFSCFSVVAQPKGFKVISDVAKFKDIYSKAAENSKSIKCDFTQEKNLSLLEEKLISQGKFHYKHQNKVRMEYTQPFSYLLIINNDKILIKDGQKSSSFSSGDNKMFRQINRIILDCVKGTVLTNKDFKTSVFENEKFFLLYLYPQNKEIKELFETINLYIEKSDYSIQKMELTEAMGDNTIITFFNKQLNIEIPDAVFSVN